MPKAKSKKAAAQKPNPAVQDPAYMPNDTPVASAGGSPGSNIGGVKLDPDLPLIPGNTATFVAREGVGRVQGKLIFPWRTWMGPVSNGGGDARLSIILDRVGEVTCEFYEDGSLYASGTFKIG